jgi:hypothetical protein
MSRRTHIVIASILGFLIGFLVSSVSGARKPAVRQNITAPIELDYPYIPAKAEQLRLNCQLKVYRVEDEHGETIYDIPQPTTKPTTVWRLHVCGMHFLAGE